MEGSKKNRILIADNEKSIIITPSHMLTRIFHGFLPLVARKRAWIQGARRDGDEGIFDNMSRRPNKRNAVDMPYCAHAVEIA